MPQIWISGRKQFPERTAIAHPREEFVDVVRVASYIAIEWIVIWHSILSAIIDHKFELLAEFDVDIGGEKCHWRSGLLTAHHTAPGTFARIISEFSKDIDCLDWTKGEIRSVKVDRSMIDAVLSRPQLESVASVGLLKLLHTFHEHRKVLLLVSDTDRHGQSEEGKDLLARIDLNRG